MSRLGYRAVLTAALVAVCWVLAAVPAVASPRLPAAPLPDLDVQIWPAQPSGSMLIVGAKVADSVQLPYTVRLPLPEGAELVWAGEVTGGGPEKDPVRRPKIVAGIGGKVAEIVLTQEHRGQYEATLAKPGRDGESYLARLDWVQTAPAASVQFGVGFPKDVSRAVVEPPAEGPPNYNEQGDQLYLLPLGTLETGKKTTITARYWIGGASEAGRSSAAPANTLLVVIVGGLIALALGALVLLVIASRRRQSAGNQS